MGRLTNKTVLITGASAGIGSACAHEFAKEGSRLILAARRTEKLNSLREALTSSYPSIAVHALELDVRDRAKVFAAINALPKEFSEVDVLVNNAGLVIGLDSIEKVTEEAIDVMLDTNVKGLLFATQAVLPGMKKRGNGHIINVSSISGREVYPGGGVYCASKHAVDALTRTLRMELVDSPINVTSIDPGAVETEFSMIRFGGDKAKADAVYKGFTPLSGTDIAETVVFAASRPPHVQIASMLVLPSAQAAATMVARK
ncbi:uncharacterized protein EV422DRAFT_522247 [Fimicolochytrium jonesii]|uniref:uncharacterized protein n=1 Tax=Fimicolochytrium jonesii TaxID=1396493 RepID=UPI0022FE86AA|nr:uncharacterized protein EV422DRAFT_522247 [Fimicolochytrium jonesii]KAI8823759.1 hypothetical protein EV422DRAFT_522247 [Fimicolochytrium jonesii]